MEFADEFEAYTERRPLLYFTPCPPNKELTEQHSSETNQPGPSHEEEEKEEEEEEREEEREELVVKGTSVVDAASCVTNIMRRCVVVRPL